MMSLTFPDGTRCTQPMHPTRPHAVIGQHGEQGYWMILRAYSSTTFAETALDNPPEGTPFTNLRRVFIQETEKGS